MAASVASVTSGNTQGGNSNFLQNIKDKFKKKKAQSMGTATAGGAAVAQPMDSNPAGVMPMMSGIGAPQEAGGGGVPPHGDESHNEQGPGQIKGKFGAKPLSGLGGRMMGMVGMPYKMKASNSSPIEKNFGSKEHRGFKETPLDMRSFGVGSIAGGVAGTPRSKTGPGGKFNN